MTATNSPDITIMRSLVQRLTRSGVNVGGTAGYPRIECHSSMVSEPMDKNGFIVKMSVSVESMSVNSAAAAMTLSDENVGLLSEPLDLSDGWNALGQIVTSRQVIKEASDTQNVLYRSIMAVDIFAERTNDAPGSGSAGSADLGA